MLTALKANHEDNNAKLILAGVKQKDLPTFIDPRTRTKEALEKRDKDRMDFFETIINGGGLCQK